MKHQITQLNRFINHRKISTNRDVHTLPVFREQYHNKYRSHHLCLFQKHELTLIHIYSVLVYDLFMGCQMRWDLNYYREFFPVVTILVVLRLGLQLILSTSIPLVLVMVNHWQRGCD